MSSIKCIHVVKETTPSEHLFTNVETGEHYSWETLPVGAIYLEPIPYKYHNGMGIGLDGQSVVVRTPGGFWNIDSRASNCGRSEDDTHRCWIRHGEIPNITVDKNGDTCNAGAGSISIGGYHGFLRDGYLVDA